ncbi:hypothetical protein G7Z17_g3115 [Cylindrodendrum hubeiense]|uniref:Uncharacterized protein n=1 Tax=Cylindrodendrum hubeiense TaxID=595255 RepID=A0A9P5HGH9_9HYPO|nr:hypothetical protein G7Z17_g3115 [Cylindrodendrum hubeiense]
MYPSWILSVVAGLAGAAQAIRYQRDSSDPFQIYAFGDGIGGVPLISSGKSAYIGNYELLDDPEAAPVVFTASTSGVWVGTPNKTDLADSSDPTWSDLKLYVPAASATTHTVGLVNATTAKTTSLQTSGFDFYGTFVYVTGATGGMDMLWYAVPSGTDGVYALRWNTTGDDTDGSIPITLKSSPPSNA